MHWLDADSFTLRQQGRNWSILLISIRLLGTFGPTHSAPFSICRSHFHVNSAQIVYYPRWFRLFTGKKKQCPMRVLVAKTREHCLKWPVRDFESYYRNREGGFLLSSSTSSAANPIEGKFAFFSKLKLTSKFPVTQSLSVSTTVTAERRRYRLLLLSCLGWIVQKRKRFWQDIFSRQWHNWRWNEKNSA